MTTEQGPSNPIPANPTYEPLRSPLVVIGPQFLAEQQPVHLTVTSRGGKDLIITDVNRTPIFQVKGKSFSIHGRCSLTDANGNNTLVSYEEKVISMHHKRKVFRGESQDKKDLLLRIKKSKLFQSNLEICLAKKTVEEDPDFEIKGNRKKGSFTIFLNGESKTIIAKMERKFDGNFSLIAYPNVDYAFIVALVVMVFLDEIKAGQLIPGAGTIGRSIKGLLGTFAEVGTSVGLWISEEDGDI